MNKQTRNDIYINIDNYFKKIVNPIVFEIGCHLGEDSHILFNLCSGKTKYYAFEPVPENYQHIKNNLLIPDNIDFELSNNAVANFDGLTDLYLSSGFHTNGIKNTMASSIKIPKNVKKHFPFIEFNDSLKVNTITIDSFCKQKNINHINFIWCDIQGCEYDMIEGAKCMLQNIDMMLLEYSEHELYEGEKGLNDILKLLGNNWELLVKTNEDILVINKNKK